MSSFISRIHSAVRLARLTRKHATMRPQDVPQGVCKEYPRMPQIILPEPQPLALNLEETLEKRASLNVCDAPRGATLQEMGTLLGHALREHPDSTRRHYPSGGRLFPIETYLIGEVLEGKSRGVYHYHPKRHALEHLWDMPFEMSSIYKNPQAPLPPAALAFTAVWARGSVKYGGLTYSHALLEAGHMAENVLLVGTALGIGMRPHSGFTDETLAEVLDIDGRTEQVVHTIFLCPSGVKGR